MGGTSTSLGFEDMSVLMGKTADEYGHYKYEGSYENIALKIDELCSYEEAIDSKRRLFDYVALSVPVRNGDAHLKNFGLLYDHPDSSNSPRLAPLYDVVTTSVYDFVDQRTGRTEKDRTLALKLGGSTTYPTDEELMRFGYSSCGVANPDEVIARTRRALSDTLTSMNGRAPPRFLDRLVQEWVGSQSPVW
jgi:serine/threonine-protein kinase HipA